MKDMLKRENGITLVALVVTIIVMLILLGVTISISLNGGLFETTEMAKKGTQKEIEREELATIVIGLSNSSTGTIDKQKLATQIEKSKTEYEEDESKTSDTTYAVKGPSGAIWVIDLNSCEVEEFVNRWVNRGLTSENVTFDKKYVFSAYNLWIKFNSNGSMETNFGGSFSADDLDETLNTDLFVESSIVYTNTKDGTGTAWVFEPSGVLKVYDGPWNTSDLYNSIVKSTNLLATFYLENN